MAARATGKTGSLSQNDSQNLRRPRLLALAGELGFEPRFSESESDVLPLNYSPLNSLIALNIFSEFCKLRQKFCKF